MICSELDFFPRGISCPPLVCATRDFHSKSGDVEGGQVTYGTLFTLRGITTLAADAAEISRVPVSHGPKLA
jgi:hypothetical protein